MNILLQPAVFFGLIVIVLGAGVFLMLLGSKDGKTQDHVLKEAEAEREEQQKKLKSAQDELATVKQELALRNQMFDGLKGQYGELEKDFEALLQKSQEKPHTVLKDPAPPQAAPPASNPPTGKPESSSPTIKLI